MRAKVFGFKLASLTHVNVHLKEFVPYAKSINRKIVLKNINTRVRRVLYWNLISSALFDAEDRNAGRKAIGHVAKRRLHVFQVLNSVHSNEYKKYSVWVQVG